MTELRTQIVTKFKNSNCDKTQKVTRLKNGKGLDVLFFSECQWFIDLFFKIFKEFLFTN